MLKYDFISNERTCMAEQMDASINGNFYTTMEKVMTKCKKCMNGMGR